MTQTEHAALFELVARLSEGRTAVASQEDIFFCFRLLLGREPNAEEVPGHMSVAGSPLRDVVATFLNSAEFAQRNLSEVSTNGATPFALDGYSIFADPNDLAVGRVVAAGLPYEAHVCAVFRQLLKPGDVVVDIGANIGFFSLLAAHLVGPSGQVVAIEPNRFNCRLIEASRIRNGYDHLQVHSVAASRSNGMLALHAASSNGSVSTTSDNIATLMRSEIVQGLRLDDLLRLDRLNFVKIDVEGFELDALLGFQHHLARFKPRIVSEFAPGMMRDPLAYIRFLKELGYQIGVVGEDGVYQDVGQDADAIIAVQKRSGGDHIDILAT